MALTGHSDDCPACRYTELPADDRAALDEAAFEKHERQAPPAEPGPQSRLLPWLVGLAGVAVFVLAVTFGGAATGVGMALGATTIIAAVLLSATPQLREERAQAKWQAQMQAWKDDQTEAWLTARNSGKTWPCPTCGSRSCTNQHSRTHTVGTKFGPFYSSRSNTDPE